MTAELPPTPPTPIILRLATYVRAEVVVEHVQRCHVCAALVQVQYYTQHRQWHRDLEES